MHADAMLGAVALAERRFGDAEVALARAATESERLGFLGQAALHLTRLGRVRHRAGLPAADTLGRAITAATAAGDLRMAATARVHLARVRRAEGDLAGARALLETVDQWYRSAGRGDSALLARCLLAAVRDEGAELCYIVDQAEKMDDAEVQLLALDALARRAAEKGDADRAAALLAQANRLAPEVAHLVDDADRLDADRARELLS